jgi:hypothetical protein
MANPMSLTRSRLVHDRFPREYAATRARHAISLKAVRHSDDDLWSFVMLPDAPPVSKPPPFLYSFAVRRRGSDASLFPAEGGSERCTVRPAYSPSTSARGAAAGRGASGAQEGAKDSAAGVPGTEGRRALAARVAGTLPSGDLGILIVRGGRR